MDERTRRSFLEKFSKNQHTEQEHELFIKWIKSLPEEKTRDLLEEYGRFFRELPDPGPVQHSELLEKIEARLEALDTAERRYNPVRKRFSLRRVLAMASAILLFITIGIYTWNVSHKKQIAENQVRSDKISPGGNRATLTLANGSEIILETAKKGILVNRPNITVDKTADGQLVYDASGKQGGVANGGQPEYNTISTPKGGQYQVVLPDGSRVWLNSASSLRFPLAFTGKERAVMLSGEAYFEVAKNKAQPFRVSVNHSTVEVLGTHFDIMGYKDEESTNTTLLEGAVKIISGNQQKLIVPGEQARVNEGIRVAKVNAAQVIEWKNGNFSFAHENIGSIMRKVARWYNVDVEYQGTITQEGFVGTVPRSGNITDVLNTLELTGLVHFKIVERRVIVMR